MDGGNKMKTDLTIVFYTANYISPKIMGPVVASLKTFDYPIISISQKPIDLGHNIVVSKERSVKNIYRQVLLGAETAKTEYVALCEDDCFYGSEHFLFRPLHFGYNMNRWMLHLREEVYSIRKRPVLSQCIANRKILIATLTERLALSDLPDNMCGEPGRLEKQLGVTPYRMEFFETQMPNLIVCHSWGILGHKKLGANVSTDVKGLGPINIWLRRLS